MPHSIPARPGFRKIAWQPRAAAGVVESPFTFHHQVTVWDGQARDVVVTLPPMQPATAAPWRAFFLKCNGPAETFYLQDSSVGSALRGVGFGAPVVDSVEDGQLVTSGWHHNVMGILKQGDWISVNDRLYEVLDDVASDPDGEATVEVWPHVRASITPATVIRVGPAARGIFRLLELPEWVWDENRMFGELEFAAREVI